MMSEFVKKAMEEKYKELSEFANVEQRRNIRDEIDIIISTAKRFEDTSYTLIYKCLERLLTLGYIKINDNNNNV